MTAECASRKIRYHSKRRAKLAIRRMQRRDGGRLHAYRCETGDHWHVGHMPENLRAGTVDRHDFAPRRSS